MCFLRCVSRGPHIRPCTAFLDKATTWLKKRFDSLPECCRLPAVGLHKIISAQFRTISPVVMPLQPVSLQQLLLRRPKICHFDWFQLETPLLWHRDSCYSVYPVSVSQSGGCITLSLPYSTALHLGQIVCLCESAIVFFFICDRSFACMCG